MWYDSLPSFSIVRIFSISIFLSSWFLVLLSHFSFVCCFLSPVLCLGWACVPMYVCTHLLRMVGEVRRSVCLSISLWVFLSPSVTDSRAFFLFFSLFPGRCYLTSLAFCHSHTQRTKQITNSVSAPQYIQQLEHKPSKMSLYLQLLSHSSATMTR